MFINKYKRALYTLSKKPVMLWGLSLLSIILTAVGSLVTAPVLALSFAVSYLFKCGMAKVYLDGLMGKQVNSTQLFAAFNKSCLRIAGGMAWKDLWLLIWMLVPIAGPVIAIVKYYSYRFVPYILMTRPEVTATDALKLSMQMTKGKKGQMFLADFCIGIILFVAFFILGLFATIPYIGILFRLIIIIGYILVFLFLPIFTGLYSAAFYFKEEKPAPAVEQPVEE